MCSILHHVSRAAIVTHILLALYLLTSLFVI